MSYRPLPVVVDTVYTICKQCIHVGKHHIEKYPICRADQTLRVNPVSGESQWYSQGAWEKCRLRNTEGSCKKYQPAPPRVSWWRRMFRRS